MGQTGYSALAASKKKPAPIHSHPTEAPPTHARNHAESVGSSSVAETRFNSRSGLASPGAQLHQPTQPTRGAALAATVDTAERSFISDPRNYIHALWRESRLRSAIISVQRMAGFGPAHDGDIGAERAYFVPHDHPITLNVSWLTVISHKAPKNRYVLVKQAAKRALRRKPEEVPVLTHVDMAVYPGEICLITGQSGCGKTATIEAILMRIKRSKIVGMVQFNDKQRTVEDVERYTSYMMMDARMLPYLSVYETLMFAARLQLPSSTSYSVRMASYRWFLLLFISDTVCRSAKSWLQTLSVS